MGKALTIVTEYIVEADLSHAKAGAALYSHSSGHLFHLWEQRALNPLMIIEVCGGTNDEKVIFELMNIHECFFAVHTSH